MRMSDWSSDVCSSDLEDCGYCNQAASAYSGLKAEKLMDVDEVLASAREAKENGSGRFCMGAAWRSPKDRDMPKIIEMVKGVRDMGMETCMTLGMLSAEQRSEENTSELQSLMSTSYAVFCFKKK